MTDGYPIDRIRADFPILGQEVHGKPLVYLDNGASAQKPAVVIDQVSRVYETAYANVHRGVHFLSQIATDMMEQSRAKIRGFLNAAEDREIIFVRGATEGINLVAASWGSANLREGDEIILSVMEHHSNIVPWQIIAKQTGAVIRVAPIDDAGNFLFEEYEKLLSPRTKMVAVTHVANSLGTIVPISDVIDRAHEVGSLVLVDGCQAAPHMQVDVQALDPDFYVFSGHKIYGPSGTGVLYGKAEHLEAMPPYQGGGEMIDRVTFEETTYAPLPFKFEAGTPDISGNIALGTAIDYVSEIGLSAISAHENDLLDYATSCLTTQNSVEIVGTADRKAAIISFNLRGIHPHDVGTILDREGIAVRTGHHCAQPVMDRFDIAATVRASPGSLQHASGHRRAGQRSGQGSGDIWMSDDLRDLYQEVIMDHYRSPRNSGSLEDATSEARGNNPLCGDRISVQVRIEDDRIVDMRFQARGCAISVASASMMSERLKGVSIAEAEHEFSEFMSRMTCTEPVANGEVDELSALMGVRAFPTRIKCATLPWHAAVAALKGDATDEVTTE